MVLTVSFELSPVIGLVCHRRPRTNVVPKPGRADITSANLTPASGRQDHTTSPYAATSLVRSLLIAHRPFANPPCHPSRAKRCRVHRTPPRVRDVRETPLLWGGMRRVLELIWGKWEQKYFSENQKKDSTALSTNRPTGKSLEPVVLSTPSFRVDLAHDRIKTLGRRRSA